MSELPGNYYEPDFEDLSRVMRDAYSNYELHKKRSIEESVDLRDKFSWEKIALIGKDMVDSFMKKINSSQIPQDNNEIKVSYFEGPKVEILGDYDAAYFVEFVDSKTNEVHHSTTITNNMWTSCSKKYYIDWVIKVNGKEIDRIDLKNKRVLISLESKSIGDTIAWAPYAIEFMKQRNCQVILSTFHNEWFNGLESYKDIEFIKPGETTNCHSIYRIGWFKKDNKWRDTDKNPNQVNLIPLQKTATDILGLEFNEINHGLHYKPSKRPIESKYVVFGPQSTAGCKEWVLDNWVKLSELLRELGYEIMVLSLTDYKIEGTVSNTTKDWDEIFNSLYHAEFFIGLSSGLSWVNWALNKPTVMIAGFSNNNHEFTNNVIRVSNNVCIKCWNDPVLMFDTNDWDWCPVYKGTERQHICQKSITPEMVINEIRNFI
jgi:autotransporter strand-loop-strand O-heptosyltransferase